MMDPLQQKQSTEEKLRLAGVIYTLGPDGLSIRTTTGKKFPIPEIRKTDNVCGEYSGANIMRLNKGVRCEDTFLFAGNLPCFAMGTVNRDAAGHMPPILGMGEFHFDVLSGEERFSFDQADQIDAVFLPNGTKWTVAFDRLPKLRFHIYASLTGDDGIAATISADGSADSRKLRLLCTVKEPRIADHVPTYFSENCRKIIPKLSIINSRDSEKGFYRAVLSESDDPQYRRLAAYGFFSRGLPEIRMDHEIRISVPIKTGETALVLSGVHAPFGTQLDPSRLCRTPEEAQKAITGEEVRFQKLLDSAAVQTPDPLLDAGIRWAVLNLDYVHVGPAWLEGGQWWNVHFTNNYQLSAATSLGQYSRVQTALRFFANLKDGYSVIALNQESLDRWGKPDGTKALGFDGLPYYLYQLWQYLQQTGDFAIAFETADRIHRLCQELLELCDPDHDHLLSWNRGVNPFMYQGDHLSVPGAGTSPSVMMAGNFARFAQILTRIGKKELADEYLAVSKQIYEALPVLWSAERGCFYSCIDLQGAPCAAHYYTDYVFPLLYGDQLPIEQKILPLLHLRDQLMFRSSVTGKLLMRVGDLKPDLFGNNNPMPVQIAETARAFFLIGDYETGYELLASCAYATSVFTENPGSSPEKLNSLGKGEPDYMFGNPAASLTYTAVAGLMGAAIRDWGETLVFEPGFPLSLPAWQFRLPYLGVVCSSKLSEDGSVSYHLTLPAAEAEAPASIRRIQFGLFLPAVGNLKLPEDLRIFCNGNATDYSVAPAVNAYKIMVSWDLQDRAYSDTAAEIKLQFARPCEFTSESIGSGFVNKTVYINQGEPYTLPLTSAQELIGFAPKPVSSSGTFYRLYFDHESKTYGTIRLVVSPRQEAAPVRAGKLQLAGGRPLDIRNLLNSDFIPAYNAWRYGAQYKIRFCEQQLLKDEFLIPADHAAYHGVPVSEHTDAVRVCNLAYGRSNIAAGKIDPSEFPRTAVIPVNQTVSAVSLLYLSETEVWLSGADQQLGTVSLRYADHTADSVPLVSRSNMGSILGNYAADTCHIPLKEHTLDSANHYCIACDCSKNLKELVISIDKEDVFFGLVAVNVYP